jgi:hypothetical protein
MAVLFGVGCVLTCVDGLVVLLLFGIEITTVGVWRCGGVAVWRCGGVAVWRCGGVALWRCGAVALWWRCGAVAVWWYETGSGGAVDGPNGFQRVPTGRNGLT